MLKPYLISIVVCNKRERYDNKRERFDNYDRPLSGLTKNINLYELKYESDSDFLNTINTIESTGNPMMVWLRSDREGRLILRIDYGVYNNIDFSKIESYLIKKGYTSYDLPKNTYNIIEYFRNRYGEGYTGDSSFRVLHTADNLRNWLFGLD